MEGRRGRRRRRLRRRSLRWFPNEFTQITNAAFCRLFLRRALKRRMKPVKFKKRAFLRGPPGRERRGGGNTSDIGIGGSRQRRALEGIAEGPVGFGVTPLHWLV